MPARITALINITQLLSDRRSQVPYNVTDILPLQFLLVIKIGRPAKHGSMATAQSNGFVKKAVIRCFQEIPVDDGRSGFSFSKFTVTTGAEEMVTQGPLFQISCRQIDDPAYLAIPVPGVYIGQNIL